ncbi:MAG: BamA/TamA family outer membrane protein [Bacteroidota bacterium]
MKFFRNITCLVSLLLLASCSMTKGLKEGERLLDAANFRFTNPKLVNNRGQVEAELAYIAKPDPATGLQKWQVSIYNSVNKKNKEKGFGQWLQKKLGRPPAIYDETTVERSRQVMEKYLHDNGYFGASIEMDTVTKGRKMTVDYAITSLGQHVVREIFRPVDTLPLTHLLKANERETLLKKDMPYSLSDLNAERTRLAGLANNHGYYDVTKDNFFYFVDTTAGPLQADIYLRLKENGDSSLHQVYYLDETWVYPDYTLERKGRPEIGLDTFRYNNLRIVQRQPVLRPTVLNRLVYQDSTQLFSKKEQQQTINRLLNLGIYKFANIRFAKKERQDTQYLDRSVVLTPGLMRDLGLEFQVNSRSGNFLGTEVSGSFSHRNAFNGAEVFGLNLSTGIENNIGANSESAINSLNVNLNASLQLPGIYAPFVDRKRVRGEVLPRTAFTFGDDFQLRSGFFTVNSLNFSAGYNFRTTKWAHEYSPVFINFINLLQTSAELDELLEENQRLRASFEDVMILGTSYTFSYSSQIKKNRDRYFFYRGGIETAGNFLNLVNADPANGEPAKVRGIPFSQYIKVDHDFRQYFPLRKGKIASRLLLGVGFPYGNAEVLPYTKQYFVGGASSIRAFRIRTLGPGGFESKVDNDGSNFVDQTGDIKLEMNLEYRFPIFAYLKGALFVDAGNIWLITGDADESTPEPDGLFQWDQFYKEIAVGTGFGLRIDFDVAVVRFDWAFAVRKPTQEEGTQWLFSDLELLSRSWRRENVVWNVAIGYPF